MKNLFFLVVLTMLVACGLPQQEQTAIVPVQPTQTPYIIVITATPRPTELATSTEIPTDIPTQPIPTATIAPAVTSTTLNAEEPQNTDQNITAPPADDDGFGRYLQTKYGMLGQHQIDIEGVRIFHDRANGQDWSIVSFDVTEDEVEYQNRENVHADLQAWATAALGEAKQHWPGQVIFVSMEWTYWSHDISDETECSHMGDTLLDAGWLHRVTLAEGQSTPDTGDTYRCA